MLKGPYITENYCYFNAHNRVDKPLRLTWTGDIQGGLQFRDIAPNTGSTVQSKNIGWGGADTVYRLKIERIRSDGTLQCIARHLFTISTPALSSCTGFTFFLSWEYESPSSFAFMITVWGGIPTEAIKLKLASIHFLDWGCEKLEDCP
ncbi:hypothetical protein V2I71_01800 [Peribacillus frigoritolerans]|uniref:hypothetical protein n=1 Tax=Peribacillus frigoritolerans TaxID=450367 RepID=UPI002ED01A44|nr:hypothetical protein V2I71_01800 [Peribacillus frigoritolerans]